MIAAVGKAPDQLKAPSVEGDVGLTLVLFDAEGFADDVPPDMLQTRKLATCEPDHFPHPKHTFLP